jgi:uncharacterized membrane protein
MSTRPPPQPWGAPDGEPPAWRPEPPSPGRIYGQPVNPAPNPAPNQPPVHVSGQQPPVPTYGPTPHAPTPHGPTPHAPTPGQPPLLGQPPPPGQYGYPPNRAYPPPPPNHDHDDRYDDGEEGDDEHESRGHGHGHGHSHGGGSASVSARTKRIVMAILIPAMVVTVVGLVWLWPGRIHVTHPQSTGSEQRAYGDVLGITEQVCPSGFATPGSNLPCGTATVRVTDGPGKNTRVTVDLPQGPGAPVLKVGDRIVLAFATEAAPGANPYSVVDHQRGQPLLYMLALCGAIIVVFGRLRGFTAIIGLAVSFGVLLYFIIPGILNGEPPLLVAIIGSAAIMFAVLYLTHGFNTETSVAIIGTLGALLVTGLLGAGFTAATKLTGFSDEQTLYLSILQGNVDMRGLLLAGIIIGALGVLDDLTVTQAATVAELAQSPTSRMELYRAATRIGRAHVASAVNTIILAYAGESLPLLLLVAAGGQDVTDLLTSQFMAQEIVRSAVGTIGLVAAVPITTALAALVADVRTRPARRRAESSRGDASRGEAMRGEAMRGEFSRGESSRGAEPDRTQRGYPHGQ